MSVADQPPAPGAGPAPRILSISDPRYPPLLREIHDPPGRLYVRGDPAALSEPLLAIVGARRASAAGLRAARDLAAAAVAAGLGVCSGLALGIDGAAHRGALDAGGRSVGVMGTGIDTVYPARHRALAAGMEGAGCLVTEYPPGTSPRPGNFPRRNRIISGLALGTVVVEASRPSGSLITARCALDQGREVFALPWSICHTNGGGCLDLIRDGAVMVQSFDDVLRELGPLYRAQRERVGAPDRSVDTAGELTAVQRGILRLLGCDAIALDELARHSPLPPARLLAELTQLELVGLVDRCAGGYIRC